MGKIPGIFRFEFENDQRVAWETVHTGVVDKNTTTRQKYWRCWVQYTSYLGIGPYLQGQSDDAVVALLGFTARVRSGAYGKGKRVGIQSDTDALGAISKTIEMGGYNSPAYRHHKAYILPLERMIESFRSQYLPPTPQLAVPVSIPEHLFEKGFLPKATPIEIAHLITLIAIYYMMQVGEYTVHTLTDYEMGNQTRTV